jgi:transposase
MHPADQYEAFAKLHTEDGMSAEDIAARFGVTAAAASEQEAQKVAGLKKQAMAEAAEAALKGKNWLPAVLRGEPHKAAA